MATQEEATAALVKVNETLVKISSETDSLLTEVERLEMALEEAQAEGGTITPELDAAIKATVARTHAIDQLVEDVPPPERA
jgi:chromosome segregation ATPase